MNMTRTPVDEDLALLRLHHDQKCSLARFMNNGLLSPLSSGVARVSSEILNSQETEDLVFTSKAFGTTHCKWFKPISHTLWGLRVVILRHLDAPESCKAESTYDFDTRQIVEEYKLSTWFWHGNCWWYPNIERNVLRQMIYCLQTRTLLILTPAPIREASRARRIILEEILLPPEVATLPCQYWLLSGSHLILITVKLTFLRQIADPPACPVLRSAMLTYCG